MVNIVFCFTNCITDYPSKSSHDNHPAEKEKTDGDGHSLDADGNLGNINNYFINANTYDLSNIYGDSDFTVLYVTYIHSLFF
jgi:hypothetical protein